jgi:O-antigen/teichoic acid export membrane protein
VKSVSEHLRAIAENDLARNAGWMMAGQGASFVFQAGYFLILARLLKPTEYGIYAGAFAFVSILAQYSSLGSGTVFLRYVSADPGLLAVYWGNILGTTMAVGTGLVLLLYFAAPHLINLASASLVLMAAVAICLCSQLLTATAQVFQAFEKMRFTALINVLANLARLVTASCMLFLLHHATALQWTIASVSVSLCMTGFALGMVTWQFGWPKFDFRLSASTSAEGLEYAFATSTASAYNDLDKAMLSHYGMNLANGIYSMAYRVIDIATIPVISIRDAAMPRLFREGKVNVRNSAQLAKKLLGRAAVISLFMAALSFIAAPLIPHMVGKGFRDSVSALRWLCLLPVFRSIHQMAGSALTGAGLQRYRTSTQLTAAITNFLLNLWLIPVHGWLGAAWASLATDGCLAAMNSSALWYVCSKVTLRKSIEQHS